jgi:hypothetical protein
MPVSSALLPEHGGSWPFNVNSYQRCVTQSVTAYCLAKIHRDTKERLFQVLKVRKVPARKMITSVENAQSTAFWL